jgi:hypothetical protein
LLLFGAGLASHLKLFDFSCADKCSTYFTKGAKIPGVVQLSMSQSPLSIVASLTHVEISSSTFDLTMKHQLNIPSRLPVIGTCHCRHGWPSSSGCEP